MQRILILMLLSLFSRASFAQVAPDSSALLLPVPTVADTSKTDSVVFAPQESRIKPAKSDLQAPVEYSARWIETDQTQNTITLLGEATVKYQKVTITAGKILIKQKENLLIAEGIPDTSDGKARSADSLNVPMTGFPVFTDGQETMNGERMEYNFKTDRGRILRGRTQFDKGYYGGSVVKLMEPKVLNVRNGAYTTCSKEEPHFHFRGQQMKVLVDDKVVAKPVVFFIGKIPLAIVPFAMFSIKKNGRQSGIIIPQFGSSPTEGRYLRNLGYYWATSDYMDMRFTMDLFERTGFLFNTHTNYAARYHVRGNIDASFTKKDFASGRSQRDWSLAVSHNQTIDQTTNLTVSGRFVSSNDFYKQFSDNRDQRLSRQLVSNASLKKNWPESGRSLTLNLSQTKDLETGSNLLTLPRLNFSQNQKAIIPIGKDKRTGTAGETRWYNAIRYSYSALVLNSIREDSTGDPDAEIDRRAEHTLNFSFTHPQKLFGWLTFGTSFNYDEDWFDRKKNFMRIDSTNTFQATDDKGFAVRRTFNTSARMSTNIYGTFFPRVGIVQALRHKMSPSLSFSYRPDFSEPHWGYYQSIDDTLKNERRLDRFRGTPRGEQLSLNYALNNLFQMKLGTGQKEKKVDLFNIDFSGNYNFAADSLKWGDLRTSFRASPRRNLTVTMGMNHSFYQFNRTAGVVDTLLFDKNGLFGALRLTRLQLDANWQLSGNKSSAKTPDENAAPAALVEQVGQPLQDSGPDQFSPQSAFSSLDIPWSASVSFSYSLSRSNPFNPTKSAYIDLSNIQVQLTKNWRIGYRLRYDIINKDILDQRWSFYRNLHCWEAEFNWSPSGIGQGYYFRIGIKAPHLRDVKLEHRGGSTTVFRPF